MRVTICGHATLYIETANQRILLDPCFSDELVGGVLAYSPRRIFDLAQMPEPTLIVITHGHFDHFHQESLAKLPRHIQVMVANDSKLVNKLQQLGFNSIVSLEPWQTLELGETTLLATPSEHEEPEFGLLVRDGSGVFWHMADAEVSPAFSQEILSKFGKVDLIAAKYQPVVRASMGYLRNQGSTVDKPAVVNWLESAISCEPKLIFPYASGLCFQGRHAWFNRYAFPFSPEEVVHLLQKRLGKTGQATIVQPGDVIELQQGSPPQNYSQQSSFVQVKPSPPWRWEPVELNSLTGLSEPSQRQALREKLEIFINGPLISWLKRQIISKKTAWCVFQEEEIVWQLVVHLGEGERANYAIDFRQSDFTLTQGEHPAANFFSHISGQTLDDVLKGKVPALIFWLAGEVRSYEKIINVRDGRFCYPQWPNAPEAQPSDPLTYYLRYFGTGQLSPNEPDLPEIQISSQAQGYIPPSDLAVLAREGENKKVLGKKVLLAYFALKEAERLGLEISPAEIETTSNHFRTSFGLYDSTTTLQWLQDNGLTLEEYSKVMRDFTAVLKLEKHYSQLIAELLPPHQRIASARANHLNQQPYD